MSKIGKLVKCSICRKEKPVHKEMYMSGKNKRIICAECLETSVTYHCPFCKDIDVVSAYYDHLVKKHKIEELAKYISDKEINSKQKPWH